MQCLCLIFRGLKFQCDQVQCLCLTSHGLTFQCDQVQCLCLTFNGMKFQCDREQCLCLGFYRTSDECEPIAQVVFLFHQMLKSWKNVANILYAPSHHLPKQTGTKDVCMGRRRGGGGGQIEQRKVSCRGALCVFVLQFAMNRVCV